ncbi:InlB B-repeat-containing protein, partial [Candidatus Saccharibacteria bacterium]|nr:InlB B-repeat-containing protein [Candidatus Saccharibacteria bacterium]
MECIRRKKHFLGDTLVEVMFAVGIFGMVAVGAISIMNRGLYSAQSTLESTMARNEVDTQAEALRFVQEAYYSEITVAEKTYTPLWASIAEKAYNPQAVPDTFFTQYETAANGTSETSCAELYESAEGTGAILPNSFVLIPSRLNSSGDVSSALVTFESLNNERRIMSSTGTYPRLLYGLTAADLETQELSDATLSRENLYSAEGIWITAIAAEAPEGTSPGASYIPEFFDFYIRTCWDTPGGHSSSTISTIVRLSNSEFTVAGTGTPEEPEPDDSPKTCAELGVPEMQNWQNTLLENPGDSTTLCDSRDLQGYSVAKLQDGQIWMTQNLRLGMQELKTDLTSENTNLSSNVSKETFASWQIPVTEASSTCAESRYSFIEGNTDLGVGYNYPAVSVDTANLSGCSISGDAISSDICPAGWHLPSSVAHDNTTDAYRLAQAYNTREKLLTPVSGGGAGFIYTGLLYVNPNGVQDELYDGSRQSAYYWTANVGIAITVHSYHQDVFPNGGLSLSARAPVRCILNPQPEAEENSCPAETICYDANGATSGTQEDQTGVASSSDVMLTAPNIVRTDYGFAGWNTEPDGSGTAYGPNQTITVGDLSASGLKLYANWIPAQTSTTLQSFSAEQCSSLPLGVPTALRDARDTNTYAVAKLADGNCWMIENLRLSPTSANLSALNTSFPTSAFLNSRTTLGSWCFNDDTATCLEQNLFVRLTNALYAGNYYNFYTATAGNGTATSSGTVSGDLCPLGWRLPSGNTSGEYGALASVLGIPNADLNETTTPTAANATRIFTDFPNNFTLMGFRGDANGISSFRNVAYLWTRSSFTSSSTGKNYGNYFSLGA